MAAALSITAVTIRALSKAIEPDAGARENAGAHDVEHASANSATSRAIVSMTSVIKLELGITRSYICNM